MAFFMSAQLVALSEWPSFTLDKVVILIGRSEECDIQIESPKISRKHCCIALMNGKLLVRDLGSTNGIKINGQKVPEGLVAPGDELTIGNQNYVLHWDSVVIQGS